MERDDSHYITERDLHCSLVLWGSKLIEDLVEPKTYGIPTTPLAYHGSLLKQYCRMKLLWLFTKVSLIFIICQIV